VKWWGLGCALVLGLVLGSAPAHAAQETKFDDVANAQLYCNGSPCGTVTAVVDVRAVKDAPRRDWDSQGKIDLDPFRTGGALRGADGFPPAQRICSTLFMKAVASNSISATSAPFGDIPLYLTDPKTVVNGKVAKLTGYVCRDIASNRAGIAFRPGSDGLGNSFVWFGGRNKVDEITIKARTSINVNGQVLTTQWAKDKIVFDD
jgi:hypothetical protein